MKIQFYTESSQPFTPVKHMYSFFREFRRKLLRPSLPSMYEAEANLLILGAARSGTTLLATMLASHSQIGVLFEDFWGAAGRILARKYKGVKLCVPNQIELRYHWSIIDLVLARIPKLKNMPPLFKTAMSKYSISDYLLNSDLKVVAILRDAESVTSSMQKRTNRTQQSAIAEWSRTVEVIHALYEQHQDRMIIVDFNNLVTAPENTARALCKFLEVDFEPNILEAYKHTPIYQTKGIEASKAVISEMKIIKDTRIKNYFKSLIKVAV